jgi:hypothetical protein
MPVQALGGNIGTINDSMAHSRIARKERTWGNFNWNLAALEKALISSNSNTDV